MTENSQINKEDINKLKLELLELTEEFQKMNNVYKKRNVLLRGFINGVGTAVGATIGFAVVIFVVSRILQSIAFIPFVDKLLDEIGVSKIIEHQLEEIEGTPTPQPTAVPSPTSEPTPTEEPEQEPV